MNHELDISRRKLLAGLGTAGVAAAGAGLGTTAYLSDTESFEGNSVEAGTLDLSVHYDFSADQGSASGNLATPRSGTVNGGDGEASVSFELADVKPGDSGSLAFDFSIVDNPGYLWLSGELASESENGTTEPEAESPWEGSGGGELGTYTRASLYYTGETSDGGNADVLITEGSMYGVIADLQSWLPLAGDGDPTAGVVDRPVFEGGSDATTPTDPTGLRLDWEVPTWVGNEVQGDSCAFDLGFHAEQARHNDGTGSWTVVQPSDDLQTAIDDAASGDTLLLAAGTHTGEVTVDKTLNVRGEGPTNTTYDAHDVGGSGGLTSGRDLGIAVRADDVRVGDLTATGADQAIQVNDNSGSRLSGAMISNVRAENNGNGGRGRAVVLNHTDGAIVRDSTILNNGNDGLTVWYTNDSQFESIVARANGDNGLYFNGDGNVLLDATVEDNAEEGVDVSWKDDLGPATQRITLDNVVAVNNGQSNSLPAGEGEDVELHDDGGDDDVADDSVLLRKVDTSGSSAPLGLRLVQVDASEVRTEGCSFPNGVQDGADNDVDP